MLAALRRLELEGEVLVVDGDRDENARFGLVTDSISRLSKEFRIQRDFENQTLATGRVKSNNDIHDLSPADKEMLIADSIAFLSGCTHYIRLKACPYFRG